MDDYTTLLRHLQNYAAEDTAAMHMPGHKRNVPGIAFLEALGAKYDITEIDGFDDLHEPQGILKTAMERASRLWGSKRTFFLVNGSTCGILAAVRACALITGSKKLIMARNCHKSVYNAAELCGLSPVYLMPEKIADFNFCGSISPQTVESVLCLNPGAPVLITSPTYEGIISDIQKIARICHSYGSPLVVDEAHGAHLDISPYFLGGAVSAGADVVIQSVHKTLTGLTQTALLHVNGKIVPPEELQRQLSIFETSSPSYLLMSSIDGTVELIKQRGKELFEDWNNRLQHFDKVVEGVKRFSLPGHGMPLPGSGVFSFDPSKIVISCRGTCYTGPKLMQELRQRFSIECEMAAVSHVVAMTGILDTEESLHRLAQALLALDLEASPEVDREDVTPSKTKIILPTAVMSVGEAIRKPKKAVLPENGKFCTAAGYIWAYPPGIPILTPGEEITKEVLDLILTHAFSGVELCGSGISQEGTVYVIDEGDS